MKLSKFLIIYLPILVSVIIIGICLGSTDLTVTEIATALFCGEDSTASVIVTYIRLPRVLAGLLAGAGLGISGVLLQTVTANELASPNIIGINSGAGLAVIITLSLFPRLSGLLPIGAFVGAFASSLLILFVSAKFGSSHSIILLIGIAVTTVLNAVISLFSLIDEDVLAEYNHFTIGSLKSVTAEELVIPAILIILSLALSLGLTGRLSLLCLGDSSAIALGINVKRLRITALLCASASAAAVVSFAGLLGFVGLVVPHISKVQVGTNPRKMLVSSAVLGAVTVILADVLGRTLFSPSELPVGILMSLIGAPYFFFILLRRKSNA